MKLKKFPREYSNLRNRIVSECISEITLYIEIANLSIDVPKLPIHGIP